MENKPLVKAFILDDDPNAMQLLQQQLKDYSLDVVGTATDTDEEAMAAIVEQNPDLLFLDVELPSGSGLDFCTQIRPLVKPEMKVVFYTGYDKYMLEALRRQAFDYILKPASRQELAKIMTRYYENKLSNIQPVVSMSSKAMPPSVMIVNAVNEHMVLRFHDIAFFRYEGDRRLWQLVTTDGTCHQLRHRTTADTILTYSSDFVQIHKSYIVNIHHIQKVIDNRCLLRPPLDHITELHISKNYRSQFLATFYSM